ncbi:hypothetical protein BCT30_22590 [Enterovibrio norvegicus]|uniref:DUF6985 domain-containing protein n=1 Tax=Enterovibrio norvegicus TaxID=188144 RepID=UPI000C81BBA2|nr:hypothetical protein [Enterovibrio norvegicus]MCC4797668.1 hypothetical protein [Enterovibrio norvegicus]PMI25618.1 hypothetical protein BCU47_23670 [Enterovibrio norvegicus]PMI33958.1 hypothetical protein BCU46_21270 [Enterovibrio norvegicus]PMN46162.1 hypothetical protein BCT30_22590 [Enterovibrio norvegicus]TKF07976.1 hypothetical protein FCV66_23240 [Enterovibrio norvegicus]
MNKIKDEFFGELRFDDVWLSEISLTMFDNCISIELIVEGNDDDETIRDEQRIAYKLFIENTPSFINSVEKLVVEYTEQYLKEYCKPLPSNADIQKGIEPTGLLFPMVLNEGDIQFGFLFESKFDPEAGVGVRYLNGSFEVSTQDILT